MGERPVILLGAQALLAVVFVGAVLATVIELSSMVFGMATGDHFQAYSVPVTWQSDGLEPPNTIEEEVTVRGVGLPVVGTVSVDFGKGWSSWLGLEAVNTALTGGAFATAAFLFFRMVNDVRRGRRLSQRHARWLTWIGALAVVIPVVTTALAQAKPAIVEGGSVVSAEAMASLAVSVPAAGLVLIVIASTLRHAAAIEHEHSLTI